jgi:hypothetical protein
MTPQERKIIANHYRTIRKILRADNTPPEIDMEQIISPSPLAEHEEAAWAYLQAICFWIFTFGIVICMAILLRGCNSPAWADEIPYTNTQIVNAIYKAEGGIHAKKPYGILSVPCRDTEDCRAICIRTVKRSRIRYSRHVGRNGETFLSYLSRKYAPIGAFNDPQGLNKNWIDNVSFFLRRNI